MKFSAKIQRVIIIPVCSVYDEQGNLVADERVKPFSHLVSGLKNLDERLKKIECKIDETYVKKLNENANKKAKSK